MRLNYYVANRGFNVKRAGEDYFEKKEEEEENEISAQMARLGIGKKKKKKKTG